MPVGNTYFQDLIDRTIAFIPSLIAALVLFVLALIVASWAQKLTQRALQRRKTDPELTLLLARLARWSVISLGLVVALDQVNFDVTGFLAGLGIVGLTIGFALQDIAKNFVSGVLLLIQQPFDIGDAIEVNSIGGIVEDIELRSTTMRTWDGRIMIVPNTDVYSNAITNFTRSTKRRLQLQVGVDYDSDLDKVTQVTEEAFAKLDNIVQDDPAPVVVFDNFGESSIDLSVYYWVETATLSPLVAPDVTIKAIKTAYEAADIGIPYPVRTVVMDAPAQA